MQQTVCLAYDGGQSGLRVSVFRPDEPTTVLAREQVDGFSWTRGGDPVTQQADRVVAGWQAVGRPAPIEVVATGLSAGGSFRADRIRLCELLGATLPVQEVRATGDDVVTHLGALSGQPGVALAAGTGTLCLAIGSRGQRRNVDGLGYLFGDEGAGFWLGRAGIRAAVRAADGRGPATSLQASLAERVGWLPVSVKRLYESPTLVADVAAFARAVADGATRGDEVAAAICVRAAHGLLGDVSAALRFLAEHDAGGEHGGVRVALGGGVLVRGGPVRACLDRLIAEHHPGVEVREPDGDASAGAMALAGPTRQVHHTMAVTWRRGEGIVSTGSPDPAAE